MGGQHRYNNSTGMGLTVKYISGTTGYLSCNTGNGGGSGNRTYNTYCGGTLLSANTWYHVAMTYNGSTIKLYVNGKLDGTHTHTGQVNVADYVTVGTWSLAGASGNGIYNGYKLIGNINDFRIYNHTLNPKEIKEISKGLSIHYQLKSPKYVNRAQYSNIHAYNNYGVPASVVATGETYMGYPVYRLTMTPNSDSVTNGFRTELWSHGINSDALSYPGTCTYWVYYKPISHLDVRVGGTASNIPGWTEIPPESLGDGWYRVGKYRTTSGNNDCSYTSFYTPSAATNVPIVIDFCGQHLVDGITGIPEGTSVGINNEIEQDASGFNQNARIIGSLISNSDSPKYDNSALFDSSTYLKLPARSYAGMANSYTIAYWAKISNMSDKMVWGFADGNRLNVYPYSWFNWNTGNGSNNPFVSNGTNVSFTPYNGAWHHYAITGNGSTTTLYIDGAAVGTAKSYVGLNGTQIIISGWDGSGYKWSGGSISDFRIYGTCLSAEDVKDLCKTSASLTNNGILMTGEFVEKETSTSKVNKNHTITAANFSTEKALLENMKIKSLPDGSKWARIHHLDVRGAQNYFTTAEVANCNAPGKFSKMNKVTNFKDADGKYEFMLTYPSYKKYAPAGYTLLDCIETTGTQYINTGLYGTSDGTNVRGHRFEFDMEMKGGISHRQLMGYGGNGGEYWGLQTNNKYGVGDPGAIGQNGVRASIVHDYTGGTLGSNKLWFDRESIGVGSNLTTSQQYQLFCIVGQSSAYGCHVKLYRCKAFNYANTLVRDFIPVRRNYDGAVGLYDLVESKFYGNNGSGAFLAHAIDKYIPIDYVEFTGSQYIDLGVKPKSTLRSQIKCMPNGNIGGVIYGVISSATGDTNDYRFFNASGYCYLDFPNGSRISGGSIASGGIYELEIGNYYVKDLKTNSYILSGSSVSFSEQSSTLKLFRDDLGSSNSSGRIYYLRIWDGDTLIRDFVPVVSTLNNQIGLFDRVNNKFYGSNTGVNLSGGGGVLADTSSSYEFLEYIQSNGGQIIDTGIAPNSNTQVDIKFSPVGAMTEHAIFGSTWSASGFFLMFYNNFIRWHSRNLVYDCTTTANNKIYNCYCDSGIRINRTNYSVTNNYGSATDSTSTIKLFSTTDLQTKNSSIKLYYCDIYKDGVLQRSFHPVRRKKDGAIGLLDSVYGGFYSSSFSAGPRISDAMKEIPAYNRWVQDSWTTDVNAGDSIPFRRIFTSWPAHSGPIKPANSTPDTVYDCDVTGTGNWYSPVGQLKAWSGGIPAAHGNPELETELWVRFDKHADSGPASVQKGGSISAQHFMEI